MSEGGDLTILIADCPTLQGVVTCTCCTDTRNRDQSEIKWSNCKIGDDQAIKMLICAAQINGSCPLTPPIPPVGNQGSRLFQRCDQAIKVQKWPQSSFDPGCGQF